MEERSISTVRGQKIKRLRLRWAELVSEIPGARQPFRAPACWLGTFGSGGSTNARSRTRLLVGLFAQKQVIQTLLLSQADRRDSRAEGKPAGRDPQGLAVR